MTEPSVDLQIVRGRPLSATFTLTDDPEGQVPTDLTIYSRVVWQVRTRAGAEGAPILEASSDATPGGLTLPGAGVVQLYLTGERTDNAGPYAEPVFFELAGVTADGPVGLGEGLALISDGIVDLED